MSTSRTTTKLYVNIADTIGQSSAIKANGGPIFQIRVTCPATADVPAHRRRHRVRRRGVAGVTVPPDS